MLTIIIESERPEKESLSLVSTPKSAMFTISVFPYLFAISSDTPRFVFIYVLFKTAPYTENKGAGDNSE